MVELTSAHRQRDPLRCGPSVVPGPLSSPTRAHEDRPEAARLAGASGPGQSGQRPPEGRLKAVTAESPGYRRPGEGAALVGGHHAPQAEARRRPAWGSRVHRANGCIQHQR